MKDGKVYSPQEEKGNIFSHQIGVPLGILGTTLLVMRNAAQNGRVSAWALLIYGISLMLMFAGSAAYHQSAGKPRRSLLRKFDHAAIYLLIAGTYTPLMLCENMGKLALIVLCIIWFLALLGIFTELFSWKIFPKMSLVLYLAMGWLCLMVFPALWRELSAQSLSFLVQGGVLYTVGVYFYTAGKKFYHMIWHFWVLGGAICQYFSVWFMLA